tara:strand:+ start:498 stop:662 length:165 start_codon:yes stop_codon:yes gene_type:complete
VGVFFSDKSETYECSVEYKTEGSIHYSEDHYSNNAQEAAAHATAKAILKLEGDK